ncbi:relaxase/mobilization nuclease domain-containing protein [Campylobacter rectus]|uniref:relaxase/mobilization nuclease domain-containing protein n=1 Tax=Campylobacter rectus TaxID=203 RepID=UPI000F5F9B1B|nr:relaxase/mobilization nuclease domain-containing protein [Campylobacter rectus]RRD53769.1 mobilization protein [Campylobacter rectus]
MLVKFLPTYTGGGLGSLNYLLNERMAAGTAKVVKGDENLTRAVIKGVAYKQKTCFGVLSFEEKHDFLDEEQKLKIIKDFERALLGDYMLERTNRLWVEHSDKNGRLELNFLIPKIDMPTGKSFNPYLALFDQHRIDLIKRMINDEYSLSSPDDPAREQTISANKKNIGHYQNLEELDKKLHELVKEGYIKNRDHMIELLNQSGIEVTRSTKKSITVVLPNQKTKNRLKGGIYDANFTGAQGLGELGQSSSRRIREFHGRDTREECERNRRKLEELVEKRDRFNKRKFRALPSRDNIDPKQEQKMDISTHSYDGTDNRNSIGLSDTLLCTGAANQENEIGCDQGAAGAFGRTNKRDGINESLDDTASLEAFGARSGWKDAVLYIGPSEQGDLRAKRQILHTYENGIEDDDIRRSIARRKRELDTDDRERKERIRIAEEGLDRKIRERDNEFATRQDKFDRSHATFDERLREQNIRIVANTKRKIREIFGVFKKEINKFARRIQRTIEKIRVIGEKRLRELDHTEIEASLDMDEEILESPEYENNNTWRMGI